MGGWTDTGFRRTLKLRIIKTEKNNMESEETFDYDGISGSCIGTGVADWSNDQLAQAPLTGDGSFNDRRDAFKSYIESVQPFAATSGITWANTRVGAQIYCRATFNDSDKKITFSLFTDYDGTDCTNPTTLKQDITATYNLHQVDNNSNIPTRVVVTIPSGHTSSTPTTMPLLNNDGTYITVNGYPIYVDATTTFPAHFNAKAVSGEMITSINETPPMYVIENVDELYFTI